jgi:hypothetical protein
VTRGPIVLDSNLLILFVVGKTDPDIISRHKNLSTFNIVDYDRVSADVQKSSALLATPNILAETSNLLSQIGEPDKRRLLTKFAELLKSIGTIAEFHVTGASAAQRREFDFLGLTDAALLVEHPDDFTLITADAPLYVAASKAGRKAINFNHLKDLS